MDTDETSRTGDNSGSPVADGPGGSGYYGGRFNDAEACGSWPSEFCSSALADEYGTARYGEGDNYYGETATFLTGTEIHLQGWQWHNNHISDHGNAHGIVGALTPALVRRSSAGTFYFRKSIPEAPPADTNLPWEFMQGISSEELLVFFPNHAIHWPAIAVRLVIDGWNYATIARLINMSRHAAATATGGAYVLREAIKYTVSRGCRQVFQRENWSIKDKFPQHMLTSLTISTAWQPFHMIEGSTNSLNTTWTLEQIGKVYTSLSGGIPCDGEFSKRVKLALQGQRVDTAAEVRNPPLLPEHWEVGQFDPKAVRKQMIEGSRQHRNLSLIREVTEPAIKTSNVQLWDLPDDLRGKPTEILHKYPDLVKGEVLLWLLSKEGGKYTVNEISDRLTVDGDRGNSQLGDMMIKKPLSRSALSKRKAAAIRSRATANGSTYEREFNLYEAHEAYHLDGKPRSQGLQKSERNVRDLSFTPSRSPEHIETSASTPHSTLPSHSSDQTEMPPKIFMASEALYEAGPSQKLCPESKAGLRRRKGFDHMPGDDTHMSPIANEQAPDGYFPAKLSVSRTAPGQVSAFDSSEHLEVDLRQKLVRELRSMPSSQQEFSIPLSPHENRENSFSAPNVTSGAAFGLGTKMQDDEDEILLSAMETEEMEWMADLLNCQDF